MLMYFKYSLRARSLSDVRMQHAVLLHSFALQQEFQTDSMSDMGWGYKIQNATYGLVLPM